MNIVARCELRRVPEDIAVRRSGEVLVSTWEPGGLHLDAYDPDFAVIWHQELGADALGFAVDDRDRIWTLDRGGASLLDDGGAVAHRVDFAPPHGLDVSGFAVLGDDLCFACQHTSDSPAREPLLARIGIDGGTRWLTTLRSPSIDFSARTDEAGTTWAPREWVNAYYGAGTLRVSGQSVLVTYADMPRSGSGIGYIVRLDDGVTTSSVATSFNDDVSAVDAGFLVTSGDSTTLYDPGGTAVTQWPAAGMHVVSNGDVRVLEIQKRMPADARMVRLQADGTVVRGDLIDGLQTSRPYVHDDGTIVFVRHGMLTCVSDLMIVERQWVHRADEYDIVSTRVVRGGDGLVTTYSRHPRDAYGRTDSLQHESGLLRVTW